MEKRIEPQKFKQEAQQKLKDGYRHRHREIKASNGENKLRRRKKRGQSARKYIKK